ncbi:M24 family metallopeptidase [Profundibacterium mesophilum]|uniref:Xaa-Pro dipeptidase n=1 Tax=Profundibacterium mesophilum KAUST100406-0324 TaxID=1037889 RepID=A0A921NPB6_9RHOB|nr:M24 family metallopeptidase [Profundibacterium mesophilum]KAF0675262.1 Xaa-Pro dipeptidase [Profundibacterium mesophilum KAUST100406-0324]
MSTFHQDFSDADYHARLTRTRAEMARRGLDMLVICDPSNMHWLTGYDGWSFYVYQAVVLGMEGEPVWWGRGMDAAGAARTVFMSGADAICGYDDSYVQNPEKHPMRLLGDLVQQMGGGAGRIGVELDNYYYSAKAHQVLSEALPGAALHDATGLVNWQRAVKSETEMLYIRRAAKIVTRMHECILTFAQPGMAKNLLVAEIYRCGIEGADGQWGDYPAIVPMAPSGMDATAPHLTWDDRALIPGEATFFEIAGAHRRYHCPQSRTLFFGEPPALYRRAENAVLEATQAGLAMARPGNFCEDIANAFNAKLNALGFEKDSRCGYSIGLSYPPDWGERTMSFRRGDRTVLEPGMVFHFMPALWLEDGGLEMTETIAITETDAECLCDTPGGIFVK